MKQPNKKETSSVVSQATLEVPAKAPQVFHMTAADFRDPAYDFRPFENWIAQVSGERALQDAINLAHRYERQALTGVEFVVSSQNTTTDESNQIAKRPISE